MGDIIIRKTTALVFAGLLLAVMLGAYTVFSAPGPGNQGIITQGNNSGQSAPSAQPQAKAGCGCGGGGQTAPDPSQAVLVNTSDGSSGGDVQDIYIKALSDGKYDKQELDVKKGIPVRLHFTADPNAGCGRQIVIYGMGISATSDNGEEDVVEFVPQQEGTYQISCGMRMWGPAELVVTS